MNIFKVLANGDGTLNEANISAFLGYLLDPAADHGLGNQFLLRFFEGRLDEGIQLDQYEYKIFFEQSFKKGQEKKEIVDIVIVAYQTNFSKGVESLAENFISNTKEVKHIFLIENKIRNSVTKGQLKRQFKQTEKLITSENTDQIVIHSIYVTPDNERFDKEFEEASEKAENFHHILWNTDNDLESIYHLLLSLISSLSKGVIDPVNDYSIQTIKSFCQFIKNDFRSEVEEKKERKNDGKYTERYRKLNEDSAIEEKLTTLQSYLNNQLDGELIRLSAPSLSSPKDPRIECDLGYVLIDVYAGYEARDRIKLIIRRHRDNDIDGSFIESLCENLNIRLKNPNSKRSYFHIKGLDRLISIDKPQEIYDDFIKIRRILEKNSPNPEEES